MGEVMDNWRRRNGNGDGPQGNRNDIKMHTAEELLAEHRRAQGFGVGTGGSDTGTGSGGSGGAGNGPPGGMVNPTPSPDSVIPDEDGNGTVLDTAPDGVEGALPRRRPGGRRGGFGVNLQ